MLGSDEDACQVVADAATVSVRYAPQFPAPRRERVLPGHLVAVAEAPGVSGVVVWRWYDAVVLGSDEDSVRLWEPAHGEVAARRRQPQQRYAPGTRAYLSAGLPGAEWSIAGRAVDAAENADVELDEVGASTPSTACGTPPSAGEQEGVASARGGIGVNGEARSVLLSEPRSTRSAFNPLRRPGRQCQYSGARELAACPGQEMKSRR